ncbi:MAG: hypothetical protein QF590_05215, partial [Dehalococcoidia bacterium]|nr:hypothetical protein [Dehalococcoidia bacterium]
MARLGRSAFMPHRGTHLNTNRYLDRSGETFDGVTVSAVTAIAAVACGGDLDPVNAPTQIVVRPHQP